MLALRPTTLIHPQFCYRNNSCLGNKYAGYRRICGVKTGREAKNGSAKTRPHQIHQIAHPIYLPPLSTSPESVKTVGGAEDVTLTIPGLAGFQMKVKANSVTFPDGSRVGTLVVSPVTADKLPMAPPAGGAQFGVPAWTIQPAGARFDPPIEVTLPNASSQPAGDNLPIVQWDHDLGQYVAMGRATVSEDGSVLITDSGSGITKAGWGGLCRYDPDKCGKMEAPKCNDCEKNDLSSQDCLFGQCVPDASKDGNKLSSVNIAKISYSTEFWQKIQQATSGFPVQWKLTGEVAAGPITVDTTCCSTGASGKAKSFEYSGVGGGFELSVEIPVFLIVKKLTGYFFTDMVNGPSVNIRLAGTGTGIRGQWDDCKKEGSTAGKLAGSLELTVSLANVTFPTSSSVMTSKPQSGGTFRPLELGLIGQADWTLNKITRSVVSGPWSAAASFFGKSQVSIGTFNVTLLDISVPLIQGLSGEGEDFPLPLPF